VLDVTKKQKAVLLQREGELAVKEINIGMRENMVSTFHNENIP
jgi:hypothetical protein